MLGEKKILHPPGQQISGNRSLYVCFRFCAQKTLSCFGDTKKLNLGGLGGTKEGLRYYILQINYFIYLASFTSLRYDKVFECKEAMWIQDNWSIFEKSSAKKNCHSSVSDIMKKLYALLLLLTPIKKVHAQKVKCGRRILPQNSLLRS